MNDSGRKLCCKRSGTIKAIVIHHSLRGGGGFAERIPLTEPTKVADGEVHEIWISEDRTLAELRPAALVGEVVQ